MNEQLVAGSTEDRLYANCLMGLSHARSVAHRPTAFWPKPCADNGTIGPCLCGDYLCDATNHWHSIDGGCHSQGGCRHG